MIERPVVSRRHARIFRVGEDWRVTDLGSLNGTRINDLGHSDKPLVDGDKIWLHNIGLTFTDQSAPLVALTAVEGSESDTQLFTAVHSAVAFSDLASSQSDARHLHTLLRVAGQASQTILSCTSLSEVFEAVLSLVLEYFPVRRAFIMLWDEAEQDLIPRCVKHREGVEKAQIRFSRTIAEKVYEEKVAVLTSDAQVDERFAEGESVFELDIHSAMAAPIWTGQRVEGLIYADTLQTRAFDKSDLDLLSALGNQLALAMERSKLQDSLVEQRLARRRLERYHSPAVVERITAGDEGVGDALVTDDREVTVLFADIVGFSERCESMEPREVADLLNRYLGEMAEVVFRHEGTLDKFIGDCLMAVFGAPLPSEDHPRRAAEAALEMRDALALLNAEMTEQSRLRFRVGMHSGHVVAGDIGSARRTEYTVLGATVNLASRLESMAEPGQIVISETVRNALGDRFLTRPLGEYQLKGRAAPIACHELTGIAKRGETEGN